MNINQFEKLYSTIKNYGMKTAGYKVLRNLGNYKLLKLYANKLHCFYKEYNFSNRPNIFSSVDSNGIIDFDLGFFYNRIQKAANSYTCFVLSKLKFGIKLEYNKEKVKNEYFLNPSELTSNQVRLINDIYKFAFVRNPYTRLLSIYLHKIKYNDWGTTYYRNYFKKLDHKPSFIEFLNFLEEGGLYKNKHWVPQTSLFALPINEFDYIGKVENYEEDFIYISKHFNLDNNLDIKNILNKAHEDRSSGQHRTSAKEKIAEYYNEQTIKKVKNLYKDDFEKLNYSTDLHV